MLYIIESITKVEEAEFIKDLYTGYMPWIRSLVYEITEDSNNCDDIAQDCMLNIIKHTDKLLTFSDYQLRAYIKIVVKNTSKNYLKRAKRVVTMTEETVAGLNFVPDDCDVTSDVEKHCDYETLKECISQLSDRDRDIITMKFELDFSDRQIARALNIKKDCVRMTVARVLKRLGKIIKETENS